MSNIDIKNIFLLEDRAELSVWLEDLLNKSFPNAKVSCENTLTKALKRINQQDFQLALIDLGLPDGSGIEAIRSLSKLQEQCVVVVVTIFDDSEHLFAAFRVGAHGYLLKDESFENLNEALLGIVEGKPPISPRMAIKMVEHFRETEAVQSMLSDREKEVLSLISQGHSVKQAAEILNVSWHTLGEHVKNIYKKLGINTRAQAAQKAQELGL